MRAITSLIVPLILLLHDGGTGLQAASLPQQLQTVLDHTEQLDGKLDGKRESRLPLWVLPISGSLAQLDDATAKDSLGQLADRGIGYTVDWQPDHFAASLAEGLRIGRWQQETGLRVGINANACLYSFYDGSEAMHHRDKEGRPFVEKSFGPELGCPFTLRQRFPAMKERLAQFLRGYEESGVGIDFIFADWEIDGPIEWNEAWQSSKKCQRCRKHVPQINDFRSFQRVLRRLRSEMQRVVFGDLVRDYFPSALVGNYGVYPHEGHRYWYDYFEKETEEAPARLDHRAKYREWYPEFPETGYSFAMPVIYTWYRGFDWYDFAAPDYRWFYNMLLVGSNAGKATPPEIPLIPFVHWHTTAPPENPDPAVKQFSELRYQELLWHLLLRGHDTFFLWCLQTELSKEINLLHEVYRDSFKYREFLDWGQPITFDVPKSPGTVLSGLRLENRVLVRRTDFGTNQQAVALTLDDGNTIRVPAKMGNQIVRVEPLKRRDGYLHVANGTRFPIGIYELPKSDSELREMADAGINIFRCGNRRDLDRVHAVGAYGWIALNVQEGATDALRQRIESVVGHPALAAWEGPDEIVWTYTAYSFLERVAGFTREDWNNQVAKAVEYARSEAQTINPNIRNSIQLIRDLDPNDLPFWINEAVDSDVIYARETVDSVDIVGSDYYAVRGTGTDLPSIGRAVKRWQAIGMERPVWMVLQGFSWHAIRPERALLYPSFKEARFMAYDAIVHDGRGIYYWGTNTIDDPDYRQSLYALTSELNALGPLLIGESLSQPRVKLIPDLFEQPGLGVRLAVKRQGTDYLVLLVNEDASRHLGVEITDLTMLEGRTLSLLYGNEEATVKQGRFVTRIQAYEVKVFATNPVFQSSRDNGRNYVSGTGD